MNKRKLCGHILDKAIMCQDGYQACRYSYVYRVIVNNGKFKDAYYFVIEKNADNFINKLRINNESNANQA